MRIRSIAVALAIVSWSAVLALPTASAAAEVMALQAGDADLNQPIVGLNAAAIAYLDANSDGRANDQSPDEPVYFDLDGSLSVTYGDLRLSGFLSYASGTLVDATNTDLGRPLTRSTGWFGTGNGDTWFADNDASRSVTAGDIRLTEPFAKVRAGDAALGQALATTQQQVSNGARVGYLDADNDRRRGLSDPVVLDVDANNGATAGRTTLGDVLITGSGPGMERDTVTQAEFDQALQELGVEEGEDGTFQPAPGAEGKGASTWGTPETMLLILGLVNLVGLAFVYTRVRDGGAPRNPFK